MRQSRVIPSLLSKTLKMTSGRSETIFLPSYYSFRLNFAEKFERDGASVAVYHKGELVVNLWGGYADSTADRVWKKDTQTLLFSATKVQ